MSRAVRLVCFSTLLLVSLATQWVWAYTPTVSKSGMPVRWAGGTARLPLAGNPINRSGISASAFFDSVVRSLQRWKTASVDRVSFDYWQGTDSSVYEPNSDYNGLSSIYFASNANSSSGQALGSNVLGLTQVWYDTSSGRILETDIVLNDINYQFTLDPRDTSGYGSQGGSGGGFGPRSVFIENVITHELGHAFGLSHSGGLQSTMLFMESPEQAFLGCDEQVAIKAIYPGGDRGSRGGVSGTVVGPNGSPIFGAQVVAISRRRGVVLASALTDSTGRYTIAALEPGSYVLMVEPFFAGASALPDFFAGMNPSVCSGQSFGRTVLTESDGFTPKVINVSAGGVSGAPNLVARCSLGRPGSASQISNRDASSRTSAPSIYNGSASGEFSVSDSFYYGSSVFYRLGSVSGNVDVRALGYSLYSPIGTQLSLLDASGNVVATQAGNAYTGTSGYSNYDSILQVSNLPLGDYTIRVSAVSLSSTLYPAGPVSVDSVPFLVVTGSVNSSAPALERSIPFNARCRMDERFAHYSSPSGNPERQSLDGDGTGFCGTVERIGERAHARMPQKAPRGPRGGGASPAAILGWLLPYLVMGGVVRVFRSRQPEVAVSSGSR